MARQAVFRLFFFATGRHTLKRASVQLKMCSLRQFKVRREKENEKGHLEFIQRFIQACLRVHMTSIKRTAGKKGKCDCHQMSAFTSP